jgi:hypothetical protein
MATFNKQSWIYVGTGALVGGEMLKWSSKGKVDVAAAVADIPVGIAAEACIAGNVVGQNIGVWMPEQFTTVQVIASAAISAGALLTAAAGGQAVTCAAKATYVATAQWMWGFANEAAAAQGDVIEMVWLHSVLSIT